MFVRKDKDGNLVGVGSIDRVRLAQLQGAKQKSAKAAEALQGAKQKYDKAAAEAKAEPKADEPKAAEPESVDQKAALDEPKAKSSATPASTKLP
jgi:sRNA-binding protein